LWRRLNREDLREVNPVLAAQDTYWGIRWNVYEHYDLAETEDGELYFQATPNNSNQIEVTKTYNPIVDTPHLFLEFARLVKDPGWEDTSKPDPLLRWISEYGLLGFAKYEDESEGLSSNTKTMNDALRSVSSQPHHKDTGGLYELTEFYIWEVIQLNEALVCYEAALSRDKEKLLEALALDEEDPDAMKQDILKRYERYPAEVRLEDYLVSRALYQIHEFIYLAMQKFVYPSITFPKRWEIDDPSPVIYPEEIGSGLEPRNLIGAIHLQFYWLVTSGGSISRCKYCNRRMVQSGTTNRAASNRKTRSDKEFCGNRCRQNYHYHNRLKPK
jgi:hypothetical protein